MSDSLRPGDMVLTRGTSWVMYRNLPPAVGSIAYDWDMVSANVRTLLTVVYVDRAEDWNPSLLVIGPGTRVGWVRSVHVMVLSESLVSLA